MNIGEDTVDGDDSSVEAESSLGFSDSPDGRGDAFGWPSGLGVDCSSMGSELSARLSTIGSDSISNDVEVRAQMASSAIRYQRFPE